MVDFADPNPVGAPVLVPDAKTGGQGQIEFIGQTMNKRRLVRQPKNPMDKCTIVSIYPKDVDEFKYTIEPGKFHIPAGTVETPGILVVGSSSWWKDIDIDQPMIEIPVGSVQVADSVVKDWQNAMLGSNMADAVPGLFFVLGEVTLQEVKTKYKRFLVEAERKQENWYKILVKLADSLWARTNGNPLVLSDDMRLAARSLNLNEKPWLKDYQIAELTRCFACGSMRNPAYPICPTCKAIDPSHADAGKIKFAV